MTDKTGNVRPKFKDLEEAKKWVNEYCSSGYLSCNGDTIAEGYDGDLCALSLYDDDRAMIKDEFTIIDLVFLKRVVMENWEKFINEQRKKNGELGA
jgi:hypothetical protein